MTPGQCPATRGRQTCASNGPHARHIWVDPQPASLTAAVVDALREHIGDYPDDPDFTRTGFGPDDDNAPCTLPLGHHGGCR